jgi:glyoxylase-like metal-dependent hydrolase (beta-lactamase superfamily II)
VGDAAAQGRGRLRRRLRVRRVGARRLGRLGAQLAGRWRGARPAARRALGAGLAACAAAHGAACGTPRAVREGRRALSEPGAAAAATTNGRNASLIYAARLGARVVVVDLGWSDAERALDSALAAVGAARRDVAAVLLTHSHRDHVGAWRAVAHAPFVVGAAEVPRLFGERAHGGWIPRAADRLRAPRLPARGRLRVVPVTADTVLTFGRDTVRAYPVPGHTAGSVAYLVRGTLFLGDAATSPWPRDGPLAPARRGFSDDPAQARRSLRRLRAALAGVPVARLCTAHARCTPADAAAWERLAGAP